MVISKKSLSFSAFDLVRQIFFANFFTPSLPYKITFALTYKCNLKCEYCKTWARPKEKELSLDKIKLVLRSTHKLRWLHLTGGEIFLRKDIEEILNFLVEDRKLAILTFPTNGVLTDKILGIVKPLAEKLRQIKLIITCGIDGTKEVHEKLRGAEGAYEKCIETFIKLRAIERINARLGVTVSRDNYRELPFLCSDLKRRISNFTFDEIHFNFVSRSFFYNNTEVESSGELINDDIYLFVDKLRKAYGQKKMRVKTFLENRYFKLMAGYLKDKKSPVQCNALGGSCFIDPYGTVYPCISYGVKVGNLKKASYDFINFWQLFLDRKYKLRKLIGNNRCPGCWTSCEAYPSILSNLLWRAN